ncbi:hypothetical protein, partial [Sphingobacterium siyangense]|uniref:hypothetical protein n=1 Tax=Sphingobacterium siyangense TaxID=459529 RepID=UPI0031F74F52
VGAFFYTEALAGNSQGLLSFGYFRISMYRLLPILRLSVIEALSLSLLYDNFLVLKLEQGN